MNKEILISHPSVRETVVKYILKEKDRLEPLYEFQKELDVQDDELYKVVNELLTSDAVVFFGSIRWGKMNAVYARLVERLTWLENRHATLGESNIVEDINVGVISVGHNWNGEEAVALEKKVLGFFGFQTPSELFWSYQWTEKVSDETKSGYKQDPKDFEDEFGNILRESVLKFKDFINF